ncbi:hypothetical protein [Microbispora siamensis]|uniref:Uncharacterized protein n=1 Tax=Microbispora siamensis TaxID=564413 RepID=A0ABQ4H1X2_9ACTN|nr:hypothetical protein [Microbispora siamensis]GIH67665.1 hypothetical protein Msi02_84820 [Microbispora siamensis]
MFALPVENPQLPSILTGMPVVSLSRAAGAAALGWLLGAGLSLDYEISEAAGDRECLGVVGRLCIGAGPYIGFAMGVAGVVLACWIGFAILNVRPLRTTVPAGIVLIIFVTFAYPAVPSQLMDPAPAGLRPLPLYALTTALALALLGAFSRPGKATRHPS